MILEFSEFQEKIWEKIDLLTYRNFKLNHKKDDSLIDRVLEIAKSILELEPYYRRYSPEELRKPNQYCLVSKKNPLFDSYLVLYLNKLKIDVFIYSFEDEWFLVKVGIFTNEADYDYDEVTYYKCDGLDGLEQFLRDNVVISSEKNRR